MNTRESFILGHRKRMFEKLYNNTNLKPIELLEILLFFVIKRRDTKQISKILLSRFKTINGVCEAPISLLMEIDGMGKSTVNLLKIFHKLSKHLLFEKVEETNILETFDQLVKFCQFKLSHKNNEEFHVIYLNIKYHIIHIDEFANGAPGHIDISPKIILHNALNYGAVYVVLVHNHPSGDPSPSSEDITTTKTLQKLLQGINISLIDHIIIAGQHFFSFKKQKLI